MTVCMVTIMEGINLHSVTQFKLSKLKLFIHISFIYHVIYMYINIFTFKNHPFYF